MQQKVQCVRIGKDFSKKIIKRKLNQRYLFAGWWHCRCQ